MNHLPIDPCADPQQTCLAALPQLQPRAGLPPMPEHNQLPNTLAIPAEECGHPRVAAVPAVCTFVVG
jgi:hypothetical protein